jgi:hypothetical protein
MKEKFIEHNFNDESTKLIYIANNILIEYANQGYRLSLRQLYYQLVARGYIPNSIRSYKRIGGLVSDARLSGLLDWSMIEDRGRETVINSHWENPGEIIKVAAKQSQLDHWKGQKNYIEVMVEKDALSGILEPVCRRLDVRFTANKGYSSSTAIYESSKRICAALNANQDVHLLYFGDHDPSGIDMTRDIADRLNLFCYNQSINVIRLALNYDQVEKWNPPENPAKETDSRYQVYLERFGESSWELDAVEPRELVSLVKDQVNSLIDNILMASVKEEEEKMRLQLFGFARQWGDIEEDNEDGG